MGNIAITSKIAYSSSAWDFIIESFPGGWDKELREFVLSKINITDEEVDNLINRWKRYFFIWLDPWEGWYYNRIPTETFTVEQFASEIGEKLLIKRIDGVLRFRCGWEDGVFFNNEMPVHPVISKFPSSSIDYGWLCHDESLYPIPTEADF